MNARIIKETRVQLPVLWFVLTCAAAVVYLGWTVRATELGFENNHHTLEMLAGIYCVGCILTAAVTFGNEYHHRTLSLLVSQPIARRKLWREKMLVLAVFNAVVFLVIMTAVASATYLEQGLPLPLNGDPFSCLTFVVFVPILCYCTTPYLTLLSKSTIGGVVFAAFGAGMLLIASQMICNRLSRLEFLCSSLVRHSSIWGNCYILGYWGVNWLDDWLPLGLGTIYAALFVPYVVILYRLGFKKFLRLEVIDSQAAELSLPTVLDAPLEKLSALFSGARAKLMLKELRLQRISFLIAAVFCALVAAEFVACKYKTITPQDQFLFDGSILIYLLFFPAIVGVTAVAEEKAWGLKDWHLTLPPSRRRQWRTKCLMALGLSFGLGAAFSFWLIRAIPFSKELDFRFFPLVLYCLLITAVAMFAASISTSNLRALLLTFGLLALFAIVLTGKAASISGSSVVSVFAIVMIELYCGALWLLWNLIVTPVWWLTHSVEKTSRVALWADFSNDHLQMLLLVICASAFFCLILRFAKANYRHSDLIKARVLRQLFILFLTIALLALTIQGLDHRADFHYMPHWTLLPAQPY